MYIRLSGLCIAFALLAAGQESRGFILGRVTDPSHASIAGAKVVATNANTNTAISATTNAEGNYEIPYLIPGIYTVVAEMTGFTKSVSQNIELRVADHVTLDFTLQVGSVSDSITVTAETPLLGTANASIGMVMDERRVRELPVVGGNSMYLTRLSAGVVVTGGHSAGNPTDYGGATGVVVNGTRNANSEATLDGVPNMRGTNNAFSPPQDLVQEFKVETTSYDASLGHAAGAVVNVSMKSGTNRLRGTAYYNDSRIRAVPWFSNNWLYNPATGPMNDMKRLQANPGWLHQRWGNTYSGPLRIPRLYDGRDRTFWVAGYEGLHIERQPTFFATVPTMDERRGDFSALLAVGKNYQFYDPFTTRPVGNGRFGRTPLPGNIIPASRLDPIAQKLIAFYPQPNTAGTADFRQNYFGIQKEPKTYHGLVGRVDHMFSEKHRIFFRLNGSRYVTGTQQLPTIAQGKNTEQDNRSVVFDDVYVFNSELLMNVRASLTYFRNFGHPNSKGYDLASLGFSKAHLDLLKSRNPAEVLAIPIISPDGYANLSSATDSLNSPIYTTIAGTVTKMRGNHSLRMGGDFRIFREHNYSYGNAAGNYNFSASWMRGPVDNSPASPIGMGLASLLYGLPTGGNVSVNASRAQSGRFSALFFQDDYRIHPRLTMNFGLRWEYESPLVERYNRTIRNFDFVTPSPISAAALAAYAAQPIPEVPVSQFQTIGGLTFAGVGGNPRAVWNGDKNNFAPRIGLAFQWNRNTVLRAGYGIFFAQIGADRRDVNQGGFNQATNIIPSNDNGQTFVATLANPFPRGIDLPPGASQGLNTFLGRGVSFFDPDPATPYMQRWSFSVQRQFPSRVVLEATYVGNRGNKLGVGQEFDPVPRQYLSTSPERDQPVIDYLSAQVANPFAKIPEFAGTGLGNQRVARSTLLTPFEHFSGVSTTRYFGFSWYHSLQVAAQKRMTRGFTIQVNYTWSKFMEATSRLNETDPYLTHVVSDEDFPMRLTISGIYELPIGRTRALGRNMNRLMDALVGGWQVQGWYEGQSGQALGFGNAILRGSLHDIPIAKGERDIKRWFNTDAGFERNNQKQLSSNIRTFSARFTGIRGDGINNLDASLFKNFKLTERFTAQFRFETYNSLNHVQLANPNTSPTSTAFGTITGEKGHGQRQLTFGGKLFF